MLDAISRAFAEALLDELTRGPDRGYIRRQENLQYIKGRLLIPENERKNAVLRHRIFVEFDEFEEDTWLNRTLKAAARLLLHHSYTQTTQNLLSRVIDEFAGVSNAMIREADLRRVRIHRNNQRYEPLFAFACRVLAGQSSAPRVGDTECFSMLFSMHQLFEEFVASFVVRHARRLGLERRAVRVQSRGTRRHLLRRVSTNQPVLHLKPDIVIEKHAEFPGVVIDTKWKLLEADQGTGMSSGDIYQLAAYAHRFGMEDNVLLYPETTGASDETFLIEGTNARLHVRVLSLDYDLRTNRDRLVASLQKAVRPAEANVSA